VHFPQEHWRKIWSTNPLERLNVAPRGALDCPVMKRRTNVVGIFPNDAAIVRLVGSQLLEQQEEWQLKRNRSSLELHRRHQSLSCQFNDQGS
jgi:putative transposase